jgi:hypothetical protein
LFDVAVRRARRFGRGGRITEYHNPDPSEVRGPYAVVAFYRGEEPVAIPILNPGLVDVQRILGRLEKLKYDLSEVPEAKSKDDETYMVKLEFIPLELQIALKEIVEVATTAVLNTEKYKGAENYIGSLLTTCNPGAIEVAVRMDTSPKGITRYYVLYSCRSHTDGKFELWIMLQEHEDELGKFILIRSGIYRVW